jgi:predicted exporter
MPKLGPRGATLIALVLAAIGWLAAARLTLVEDLTALLPERDERGASTAAMARRFGMMRRLVVVVGPGDAGAGLHRGATAIEAALGEVDGVVDVIGEVDEGAARRAAELLLKRAARLHRPSLSPLSPRVLARRLAELKDRLAVPEAIVMQPFLLEDPIGLARGALRGLESAGRALGTTVDRGRLVSADGRHALVLARLGFDPMELDRSRRFLDDLDGALAAARERSGAGEIGAVALSGAHFVVSSSGAIISDVRQAFVLTTVLVLAVFLLFFRRVRLLPAALLPGGLGIAAALGVMAALGEELHALTLGFAATITGLSVDYAIHLLHRAGSEPGGETGARIDGALRAVSRPIVLGCLTTFGALVLVATSGFTGVRQLALFAAISLPVAMAVTLTVLPAFHGLLLGGARSRVPASPDPLGVLVAGGGATRRWLAIALAAALLAAGIAGGLRVHLSGDPREMGAVDPELDAREAAVKAAFPGLADQAFVVASGKSLDAALEANDRLYERLVRAGVPRDEIVSLSPFLPAPSTQEASLEVVAQLFDEGPVGRRAAREFRRAGFREVYFARLKAALDAPPITPRSFEKTSLGAVVSEALVEDQDGFHVMTRIRAADDGAIDRLAEIAGAVSGCRLASERLEARAALTSLQRELARMLATWLVAALVLLTLSERSFWFGLKAALPAVLGVAAAVGLFGLAGRPLTPVASAGMTLVMGLGIDYGIFMLARSARPVQRTAGAVLASALTTLAAFGVLSLAATRAMADLGLIILVGVTAALATALVVLPALAPRRR